MRTKTLVRQIAGVIAGAVALTPAVYAQLEEVVVTATKREESIQDIPLSIESFSGEAMVEMGIADLTELSSTVPNVSIGYGITSQNVIIRGLGSGQERSFEQSVGMFIDGFYMPRSRQYQNPFFDAARVEVVRGPQSVIHGLNSTAGAVSIVSNKTMPGDPFFAEVTGDYEFEYGGPTFSGVIGGSPSDTVGVRAAIRWSNRDGFFDNSFTGDDEGETDSFLARVTVMWQPREDLTFGLKVERAEQDLEGNTGELFSRPGDVFAATTAGLEPTDGRLNWERSSNGCEDDRNGFPSAMSLGFNEGPCPNQRTKNTSVIGSIEWELPGHTLNVVGGRSTFEYNIHVDLDTSADSFVNSGIDENFEMDAFEIRLTSDKGGTIDYLAGFYYHKWDNFNANPADFGPATLGGILFSAGGAVGGAFGGENLGLGTNNTFDQESELWSIFGQATWNITDYLRLTGGLRYTDEKKKAAYNGFCDIGVISTGAIIPTPIPGPAGLCSTNPITIGLELDRSSDNLLPEVAIQWDATEDLMLYAKWGESAKSGGFTSAQRNGITPDQMEYDDEDVTGYEIGFKSRWFDNKVELNLTAFYTEFDDLQVNSFIPVGLTIQQRVTNAAKAESKGIEVDGLWQATDWLLLGGSFAVLDAEYDEFENGTCNIASGMASPCDQTGEPLPHAADYSGNVFFNIAHPMSGNMNFVADLNLSFRDDYFTDASLEPTGRQGSWEKIDARVGVEAQDGRWSLALIGRNLTDKKILSTSQSFFSNTFAPTMLGYLNPPRTLMLQGRYQFSN